MQITEKAMEKLKTFITNNSSDTKGIRIAESTGCCGPSIGMIIVDKPNDTDIKEVHEEINFYLDELFKDFSEQIKIDFNNEYFQLLGLEGFNNSCCG